VAALLNSEREGQKWPVMKQLKKDKLYNAIISAIQPILLLFVDFLSLLACLQWIFVCRMMDTTLWRPMIET